VKYGLGRGVEMAYRDRFSSRLEDWRQLEEADCGIYRIDAREFYSVKCL
jgi:hypothetical protein